MVSTEKRRARPLVFLFMLVIIFCFSVQPFENKVTNYTCCDRYYEFQKFFHDFTSFHANGSDDNIYIILYLYYGWWRYLLQIPRRTLWVLCRNVIYGVYDLIRVQILIQCFRYIVEDSQVLDNTSNNNTNGYSNSNHGCRNKAWFRLKKTSLSARLFICQLSSFEVLSSHLQTQ